MKLLLWCHMIFCPIRSLPSSQQYFTKTYVFAFSTSLPPPHYTLFSKITDFHILYFIIVTPSHLCIKYHEVQSPYFITVYTEFVNSYLAGLCPQLLTIIITFSYIYNFVELVMAFQINNHFQVQQALGCYFDSYQCHWPWEFLFQSIK